MNEQIKDLIMDALSLPPSKVNLRLKPEQELAKTLGVGRRRLRSVLLGLEEQGFFVRRRGSGTYVRRVPEPSTKINPESQAFREKQGLRSEDFFAIEPEKTIKTTDIAGPGPVQKQLRLELWKDLHSSPTVGQSVVNGMIQQVNALGHQLTIHSLLSQKNTPLTANQLKEQLRDSSCEGYIVTNRWADMFTEARGDNTTPAMFYSMSKNLIRHEPHFMIDTAEAIDRAVGIFANLGHKRIGALSVITAEHDNYLDAEAYECAMSRAGLEYRAIATSVHDITQSIEATLQMLSRPDAPQAIYVNDNFLMGGVAAALRIKGLVPGRDIAIITHSNVEHRLPAEFRWSHFDFDLHTFGRRLIDELLLKVQCAGVLTSNVAVFGKWQPGDTHILNTQGKPSCNEIGLQQKNELHTL